MFSVLVEFIQSIYMAYIFFFTIIYISLGSNREEQLFSVADCVKLIYEIISYRTL